MSYWDKYRSDDPRRIPPLEAPLLDYVVVDTETTGLNPEDGAKLIEIGAVKVKNGRIVDTYSQLINPQMIVPPHITQLTGITTYDVSGKPTVKHAMKEFERWLGFETPFLAHNATFDLKFLDWATAETWPNRPLFDHPFLDTLEMSRDIHPEIRHHKVGSDQTLSRGRRGTASSSFRRNARASLVPDYVQGVFPRSLIPGILDSILS